MPRFSFFATTVGLMAAIGAAEWYMYQHGVPLFKSRWSLLLFFLLPVAFFAPHFMQLPQGVARVSAYVGGYWYGFVIYSLLAALLYFFLYVGCAVTGHGALWDSRLAGPLSRIFCAACVLIVAISAWWAQHRVIRDVTITTDKAITQDLTIAFITDIHLGTIWGTATAEELAAQVNATKPDLILFGGDMVDDSLGFVLREGSGEPLSQLRAPFGVYGIMGNHDYIDRRPQEEIALWERQGMHFLVDSSTTLPWGVELTGLRDWSQGHDNDRQLHKDTASQALRILLDHQPRRPLEAQAAGYDLYLCGHTHAGQFWPVREITKRMYLLDYGTLQLGQLTHITSCGYGLWGLPIRNGPRPEVVLIHVKKK